MASRTARPRRTIRNPSRPAAAAGASKVSVEGGVTRGVPWMPRTSPEDDELVVVDDTPPDSLVVVSLVDVLVLEVEVEVDDVSLVDVLVLELDDVVVESVQLSELDFEV